MSLPKYYYYSPTQVNMSSSTLINKKTSQNINFSETSKLGPNLFFKDISTIFQDFVHVYTLPDDENGEDYEIKDHTREGFEAQNTVLHAKHPHGCVGGLKISLESIFYLVNTTYGSKCNSCGKSNPKDTCFFCKKARCCDKSCRKNHLIEHEPSCKSSDS
jgi:hypothetical protein